MKLSSLIFLSFLVLINTTQAQYFDPEIVNIISGINKQEELINYPQTKCLQVMDANIKTSSTSVDLNNCALALCGPPEKNKTVLLTNANFNLYYSNKAKKEVEEISPLISKFLDKIKRNKLKRIALLESELQSGTTTKLNPNLWSIEYKTKLSQNIFSPFLSTSIDLEKPIGQRFVITINNTQNLDDSFKEQLNAYALQLKTYNQNDLKKNYDLGISNHQEFIELAQKHIENISNNFENLLKDFSDFEKENLQKRIKDLASKLETTPLAELVYHISYIETQLRTHNPNFDPNSIPPVCDDRISSCSKIYLDYFGMKNLPKQLASLKKELNDPKVKKQAFNQCKALLIAKNTDRDNKEKAAELFKKVKEDMNSTVLNKFSEHSKAMLQNYYAQIFATEINSFLTNTLSEDSGKMKNFLERDIETPTPAAQENALAEILNQDSELGAFGYESSPCNNEIFLKSLDLTDFPNPQKTRIMISDFSCQFEAEGLSIIAHELGHATSNIFSKQQLSSESMANYKQLRKCATQNYIDLDLSPIAELIHQDDKYFTEEDTADLFSFMTYPDQKQLFTCSYLLVNPKQTAYTDVDLISITTNIHSKTMYRVLMEAINKGREIPLSCQKAMDAYKNKLRFKKCVL